MNMHLFMDQIQKIMIPQYWKDMVNESNSILSVMTIHLTCEYFLESYICAYLNLPDFFQGAKERDKVNFKLTFSSKLALAQKLGLPIEAYKAIDYINRIRNQFAHRLEPTIDINWINKIEENVNLIQTQAINNDVKDEKLEFFSNDGQESKSYNYTDSNTPPVIKLAILYSSLFRRLISFIGVKYFQGQ